MKAPWQAMTGGDWLVVLFLLCFSLAGIAWVAAMPAGSRVLVYSGKELRFTAPLGQVRRVAIGGPLGQTLLAFDEQGVRVVASPCPRQLCVSMGPARQTADLLACVPNRILVRIVGSEGERGDYDLLSR